MANRLQTPAGENVFTWEVATEGRWLPWRVVTIGFTAAWAMLGFIWLFRLASIHSSFWKNPNFEYLCGTWVGLPMLPTAFILGMFIHSLFGVVFALPYAWLFEFKLGRVSARLGAAIATAHALITGVLLLALPYIHPGIPEYVQPPGLFWSNIGIGGVVGWFTMHAIYGFLVGYKWRRIITGAGYPEKK